MGNGPSLPRHPPGLALPRLSMPSVHGAARAPLRLGAADPRTDPRTDPKTDPREQVTTNTTATTVLPTNSRGTTVVAATTTRGTTVMATNKMTAPASPPMRHSDVTSPTKSEEDEEDAGGKLHALSDTTVSSSLSGGNDAEDGAGSPAEDAEERTLFRRPLPLPTPNVQAERLHRHRRPRPDSRPRFASSVSDGEDADEDEDDVGCATCSSSASLRLAMARMADDASGLLGPPPPPMMAGPGGPDSGPPSLRRQLSQSFIEEPSSAAALFKHLACLQWKSFVPGVRARADDEDDEDDDCGDCGDADADVDAAGDSLRSMRRRARVRTESCYQSPANRNRRRRRPASFTDASGSIATASGDGSDPEQGEEDAEDEPYDEKYVVEQKHRAFWELVQRILNLSDVVLMVRHVLEFLNEHVEASAGAVFLVDQNSHEVARIARGQGTLSGIAPGRGLVGAALAAQGPLVLTDFAGHPMFDAGVDLPQEFPGQKLLSVPLTENDVVYAVVQATTPATTSRPEIDELHVKLLTWLGPILSSCMRNCIEFHDVMLSERTQKALLHIISSSDTEDTVLNLVDGVIVGACHITKAERVSLFLVDWETQELWSLSSSHHAEKLRVPLHNSILGLAAKSQTTLNVFDPQTDPRFNQQTDQRRGIHVQRALYVPVGVQQTEAGAASQPLAVLEILNKEDGAEFTFDDECAFEAFACEVAVILRRRSTEIAYMKLLADTRAEQVVAQRASSQVNLLDVYTSYSYSSTAQSPDSIECLAAAVPRRTSSQSSGLTMNASSSTGGGCTCGGTSGANSGSLLLAAKASKQQQSGRLKYDFHSRSENSLFAAVDSDAKFLSWDFNVFNTDSAALTQLLEGMFLDFKVDEILRTSKYAIQNFIVAMKEHYHPNPFHNFLHAFSVVHSAYLLLTTTDAAQLLQPLDVASCLVAALGHDVDHPGHTNGFEIVSGSQLALLYSDESVLERHHAYTTFRLIAKEKNANILQNLTPADFRQVRKFVITAILGTDMANHFKFCEALEKQLRPSTHHLDTNAISTAKRDSAINLVGDNAGATLSKSSSQSSELLSVLRDAVPQAESGTTTPRSGGSAGTSSGSKVSAAALCATPCRRVMKGGWVYNGTLDDRLFLVKALVHTSDLSGQAYATPVALKWSNMISKEFAYQALLEQAEGLPVTYKHINDPLQMVEGQLFFAQKLVSPLWDLMALMFPELDVCVRNLATNVRHYEHEFQRLKLQRGPDDGPRDDNDDGNPNAPGVGIACRDSFSSVSTDDGDGLAVPGLAKHNPAQFNSFRAIPEAEEDSSSSADIATLIEEDLRDSDEPLSVSLSVLSAALSSSQPSLSGLSRSASMDSSSSSSSSCEVDEVMDVVGSDLDSF